MGKQTKLLIIGAGGHGAVALEAFRAGAPECEVVVFDDAPDCQRLLGVEVQQGRPSVSAYSPDQYQAFVAIGRNETRLKVARALSAEGYTLATIVHPTAWVSPSAALGAGCLVGPRAVVNARAQLGDVAIANTSSIIEHDCVVEDGGHICPGATLAGGVRVGSGTMIGANSTVKELVKITGDSIVGAGSVVTRDISVPGIYYGVPANQYN